MMRGQTLLRAFMKANLVGPKDFFGSKKAHHVALRFEAMQLLYEAGLRKVEISRIIRRDETTVGYWLIKGKRERYREVYKTKSGKRRPNWLRVSRTYPTTPELICESRP